MVDEKMELRDQKIKLTECIFKLTKNNYALLIASFVVVENHYKMKDIFEDKEKIMRYIYFASKLHDKMYESKKADWSYNLREYLTVILESENLNLDVITLETWIKEDIPDELFEQIIYEARVYYGGYRKQRI